MPTNYVKQITTGAQEFLGAHAYFFTEGIVPTNVNDHSNYFRIHDWRQRDGSWEAIFQIDVADVATELLKQYFRELTKDLPADAATISKYGFMWLIFRSYRAWQARQPLTDQVFDRIEPVLRDTKKNGAPIFDEENDADNQRRNLLLRVDSSLTKMTSPIGRAATRVEPWFNDQRLDCIERRHISDDDLAAAIQPLRAKWDARLGLSEVPYSVASS